MRPCWHGNKCQHAHAPDECQLQRAPSVFPLHTPMESLHNLSTIKQKRLNQLDTNACGPCRGSDAQQRAREKQMTDTLSPEQTAESSTSLQMSERSYKKNNKKQLHSFTHPEAPGAQSPLRSQTVTYITDPWPRIVTTCSRRDGAT